MVSTQQSNHRADNIIQEKFENFKGAVIINRRTQYQKEKDNMTMVNKPLHGKLKIEQHEPH